MKIVLPDLATLPTTASERPFPLITIYGQAGIGKTTFACEFPRPILINVEGGTPAGIDITFTGIKPIRAYNEFIAWLEKLRYEDHKFKSVIIDSLDTLEKRVVQPYVKKVNDFDSIDQTFGKAYTRCAEQFDVILEHLEDLRIRRKMYIVITAAAIKEQFDEPIIGSYNRYNLGVQNQISTRIFHQSDFMFFMRPNIFKVKADAKGKKESTAGTNDRMVCTTITPTWVAKSRAQGVPEQFQYQIGNGFQYIKPYLIDFIRGVSKVQEVEAPLQVEPEQTVAEARAIAENPPLPPAVPTTPPPAPVTDNGSFGEVQGVNYNTLADNTQTQPQDDVPF